MTTYPSAVLTAREATPDELRDWDEHTVAVAEGHALQSMAWARYRATIGWQPTFLVLSDGSRVLCLRRSGRLIRPDRVYISRGPVPTGPDETASRLEACVEWYRRRGVGLVISDAEVPADTGYPERLARLGYRRVEEIQPSRHRLSLDLREVADPEALLKTFTATTRNMIRAAGRSDLTVSVLEGDAAFGPGVDLAEIVGSPDPVGQLAPAARADLTRFHDLVLATGQRKGFAVASRARYLDWTVRGLASGIAVHVSADEPGGSLVAAATFYRHGRRWTYALAGDDPAFRKRYGGAVRLVLWEAIRRAIAEGREEMDLGGVDVPGARRRPTEDEPEHGMLAFKESFGARWLELSGAHAKTLPEGINPVARLVGRFVG
jgi:lipid II:glycine glycyltransferase (peptidoglycan interpeptide bridge formation enzyme)